MNTIRTTVLVALCAVLGTSGCEDNAERPAGAEPAATGEATAEATGPQKPPATPKSSRIVTEETTYTSDGTTMNGYLATPAGAKAVPGVLVVHEWWGLNDYARTRAEMLAKEGYAALAVDMYGEGKRAEHPADAKKFSSQVIDNLDAAERRFRAAMRLLAGHPSTDPDDISAIGYCFGGGIVLHMARIGTDLDLVASFHGSLEPKQPAAEDAIKAKLFVAHGGADPMVPPEQVEAFKKEMERAGVDLTFRTYEGAKHAFTNPAATQLGEKYEIPIAYDQKADRESWQTLLSILRDVYPRDTR